MPRPSKRLCPALLALAVGCAGPVDRPPADARTLVTGKDVVEPAAPPARLGTMPMTMAATPDGKFVVVSGMGYADSLYSVSTATGGVVSKVDFPTKKPSRLNPANGVEINPEARAAKSNGLYFGVAVAGDRVYAGQGAHDTVAVLSISPDGALKLLDPIRGDPDDFPAGVAVDDAGRLFAVDNGVGDDFVAPAGVTAFDPATGKKLSRFTFDTPLGLSNFPLAIVAGTNKIYVTGERDGVVYDLNTTDPTRLTLTRTIATGSHPVAVLLSADKSKLFVANAQSDTVSIVDTASDRVTATVLLRPGTSRGLAGVTPTGLALSADGARLFVTLADMDAVAVVDVPAAAVTGLIPAGWYPSAVAVVGDHLLVVNAKGTAVRHPNPKYVWPGGKGDKSGYSLSTVQGDIEPIDIPSADKLADSTAAVLAANHLDDGSRQAVNPLAAIGRPAGKIKHVVYVIKENRTYDQEMGDDPRGNGDPSLTIFGKEVTPNLHALADRFALIDNSFACGEVSGDGWTWSTQSIANAYTTRNVPYNYSGRGRSYDSEGENSGYITGGFPANNIDGKPNSADPRFKNGAPAVADVSASDTHLWDVVKSAGLTYRNYGFFLSAADPDKGELAMPANYPTVAGLQPPGHDGAGVTDADFRRFDFDYPDSDAAEILFKQTGDKDCLFKKRQYGAGNAPSRIAEWRREFDRMIAADPTGNSVPALTLLRLPNDHTAGLAGGKHTPRSMVADNDYAVGELVEALSHSPAWQSTAVFIVEDDAQAGPDHVDCHRMPTFVISPWVKRATVDHRFNNTDTVLKTIECLLGLPPMSQYDAIARPMDFFDAAPTNAEPYSAILPPKEIIADTTSIFRLGRADPATKLLVADSDRMNFTRADAAPADRLNQIIWQSVRGTGAVMPEPKNTLASPATGATKKKDDDD